MKTTLREGKPDNWLLLSCIILFLNKVNNCIVCVQGQGETKGREWVLESLLIGLLKSHSGTSRKARRKVA